MKESYLWISVWSYEALTHNQFLGETWIKFDSYNLDESVREHYKLKLYDCLQTTKKP